MDSDELRARRADVEELIGDDPSTFIAFRRGLAGADETTFTFTGRLVFLSMRTAATAERSPEVPELPVAEYPWLVMTYYNTEEVKAKDELDCISPTYGRRRFRVGFVARLEDRQEVLCRELA